MEGAKNIEQGEEKKHKEIFRLGRSSEQNTASLKVC